jgi:Lipoprotein LpqB beta-propeller domain/Sporulation and spore germination
VTVLVKRALASRGFAVSVAAGAVVLAAACTAVPDTGPVHAGNQAAGAIAPNVRVAARPPVPGDDPAGIVSGFRFANSDIGSALGIAKAYLADGASWQPRTVVVVAETSALPTVITSGDTATVKDVDTQVGTIAADGTFEPSPSNQMIEYDYQLTKAAAEKGEWRITNAPPYLVLTVDQIESSYQSGYVYFLRPDEQMLVPVRVFLPVADHFADALLTTLLQGPPAWLKPAVTTALPPHATLVQPSTEENGVTTVDLSQDVASLSSQERSALAAQISFTLSNSATPVQDFGPLKILAGGQPLVSNPQLAVQTAKDWKGFDGDALGVDYDFSDLDHGTRDHLGRLVPGDTGELEVTSLLAPALVPRAVTASTPALIAGVVQGPNNTEQLYAGPLASPKRLLTGSTFTTPSWDSLGNLWTVQQATSSSVPQIRIAPAGKTILPGPVAAPFLANKVIEELKVSRDGTRVAVLAVSTNVSQVFVGAVTKDGTALVNFYPVAPSLTTVTDFAWASSTQLDILGTTPNSGSAGTFSQLWAVDVDGWPPSLVDQPVLPNADAIAAAPGEPLVIGTSTNLIEQYNQNTWEIVGTGTSPRYPG